MPERINGGQALVVVGAIALIVSLFGDWFQPGLTAWTVFESMDLLLAALAVAALAIAVSGAISPEGSLAALAPRWLPVIGIAALVIVVAALSTILRQRSAGRRRPGPGLPSARPPH